MRESLLKHCPNSMIYIFAFDQITIDILSNLKLEKTQIISLNQLEKKYSELIEAKTKRNFKEYFWTTTPFVIDYVLSCYGVDNVTYVDADCYFFNSPAILIDSIPQDKVVSLSPHNFSQEYQHFEITSGKYCVEFLTFKNCLDAKKVLNWWKESCANWCHDRFEDGKFGDQKYLENFKNISSNCFDLEHLGQGIAPWNSSQYDFFNENNKIIFCKKKDLSAKIDLIYIHFHNLKTLDLYSAKQDGYSLDSKLVRIVYLPYLKKLTSLFMQINPKNESLDYEKLQSGNKFIFKVKALLFSLYLASKNKHNRFFY